MKKNWRYIIIFVIAILLWNTKVMIPLKTFTVFLHELGHTLMAFLFGYGIQAFKVNLDQSGYVVAQTKGWFSSFMVANGGYLGSLLFALLILYLRRTRFKKYILGTLAIVMLLVTIRYSKFSYALLFAVLFTIVAFLLYMTQKDAVTDWVIDILGISSVAYAIYDTFVDTILLQLNIHFKLIGGWTAAQPNTDAVQLQRMTGIPSMVWGILWLAIAVFAVYAVLLRKSAPSRGRR